MENNISAVLLAAGLSSRMGQPKLLLPWGRTTVLGQVVSKFAAAGMEEIIIVTGGAREQIEGLVAELVNNYPVRTVYNPAYARGEMLSSIQAGLAALDSQTTAALIGLGDQPQVRESTVRRICTSFVQTRSPLVIPSFQNRRGHPWLAARPLWPKILGLTISTTPRQFFNTYTGQVEYVAADESILQDLDTPEDYARQRPYRVLRK
jgi:molybdenum cofactor cytidylyltransferase